MRCLAIVLSCIIALSLLVGCAGGVATPKQTTPPPTVDPAQRSAPTTSSPCPTCPPSPTCPPTPTCPPCPTCPPPSACMSPCDALKYVGKQVCVEGMVVDSRYATTTKGQPTFLNFGAKYPNHCFTAVIWVEDRGKFCQPPETCYLGKTVRVMGTVKMYEGKPEIELRDASQISIVR